MAVGMVVATATHAAAAAGIASVPSPLAWPPSDVLNSGALLLATALLAVLGLARAGQQVCAQSAQWQPCMCSRTADASQRSVSFSHASSCALVPPFCCCCCCCSLLLHRTRWRS